MAESPDNLVDQVQEEDGDDRQNEDDTPSEFTAELNLLIVLLSLCSPLDSEESLNLAKKEQEEHHEDGAKARTKRLQNSKRELDEAKPVRRLTTQRFNTKVRDIRHGRKM